VDVPALEDDSARQGLNITNHNNPQVIGSTLDPATGLVVSEFGKGLPILPTAGLVFEF